MILFCSIENKVKRVRKFQKTLMESRLSKFQILQLLKHLTEYSLSSLSDKLNNTFFFRLNRQVIVSLKSIKEFDKLEYQKLGVRLIDDMNFEKPIIVSKYNAPAFKKWITNSQI